MYVPLTDKQVQKLLDTPQSHSTQGYRADFEALVSTYSTMTSMRKVVVKIYDYIIMYTDRGDELRFYHKGLYDKGLLKPIIAKPLNTRNLL